MRDTFLYLWRKRVNLEEAEYTQLFACFSQYLQRYCYSKFSNEVLTGELNFQRIKPHCSYEENFVRSEIFSFTYYRCTLYAPVPIVPLKNTIQCNSCAGARAIRSRLVIDPYFTRARSPDGNLQQQYGPRKNGTLFKMHTRLIRDSSAIYGALKILFFTRSIPSCEREQCSSSIFSTTLIVPSTISISMSNWKAWSINYLENYSYFRPQFRRSNSSQNHCDHRLQQTTVNLFHPLTVNQTTSQN